MVNTPAQQGTTKQREKIKMKKPTVSQIKQSEVLGPHYFTRSTMAFFNQTMADFKTQWHDKALGIVRVFAPRGVFTQRNPLGGNFTVSGVSERFVDISGPEWKQVRKGEE